MRLLITACLLMVLADGCKKSSADTTPPVVQPNFLTAKTLINNQAAAAPNRNTTLLPVIKFIFSANIDRSTVSSSISFINKLGTDVPYQLSYENHDSAIVIQPAASLTSITAYSVSIATSLTSIQHGKLTTAAILNFSTAIDPTDKFPRISDSALLDLVEKQTFKYFWDFAHPVSGLARERNTSDETVTSGGSGFGIMSIPVAVQRSFITRAEGLARMQKIVGFLKNTAQKFHGAFPHWLNGGTGVVIPFSTKDDGADLVETSYLMAGLLTARQYFNTADAGETTLRSDINSLWNAVEWSWFRQNNQDVLYWHWSPDYNWDMNFPIRGWNEALITYVLASSSATYSVPKTVYDKGWAGNSGFINNNTYYGYQLPLGPPSGGPLFFAHYSFLGINPHDLTDAYANYWTQNRNHTLINYNYCKANPKSYFGYSDSCWGLTASDISNGYTASSPTNDVGVIAPTAALSSFPYTPVESMQALKFYYYRMGDKLWGPYGFYDAFSLDDIWFANSTLAIDQGPVIAMIENYRSGLLWNLFMSCPEVKTGMQNLGFQSPNL